MIYLQMSDASVPFILSPCDRWAASSSKWCYSEIYQASLDYWRRMCWSRRRWRCFVAERRGSKYIGQKVWFYQEATHPRYCHHSLPTTAPTIKNTIGASALARMLRLGSDANSHSGQYLQNQTTTRIWCCCWCELRGLSHPGSSGMNRHDDLAAGGLLRRGQEFWMPWNWMWRRWQQQLKQSKMLATVSCRDVPGVWRGAPERIARCEYLRRYDDSYEDWILKVKTKWRRCETENPTTGHVSACNGIGGDDVRNEWNEMERGNLEPPHRRNNDLSRTTSSCLSWPLVAGTCL